MPTIETVSWQFGWSSLYPAAAARGLSPKAWVAFLPGGSRLMDARVPPLVAFCFFPEDKLGAVCNRSPQQVSPRCLRPQLFFFLFSTVTGILAAEAAAEAVTKAIETSKFPLPGGVEIIN